MRFVDRLEQLDGSDPDALFDAFSGWTTDQGLELYPAQTEALIELVSGSNVILATPTGSGKSLVAAGAHFAALAQGRRSVYTAPIKALVSEKFFALCDMFGADKVGMLTGDASVNPDAPIITATAEVLANQALREGADTDVGVVVMDEFHYYSDPERGWAWQVPLLELPRAQFLLMSATLGDVSFFESDLTRRTARATAVVATGERPVPLTYYYATTPVHETLDELLHTDRAPVYVVHFTQVAAIERAQALTSVNVATRAERDEIAEMIGGFRFSAGFGRTLSRLVRHGIGVHHAGMLPRYRRLVETLAQAGLLKVICGTDTLGVGINVPIRTVLITALSKYDGSRTRHLTAREFHQIAGRAGRAGFDTAGTVVVQAPDHVVENEKAKAKAGDDPKKLRKLVKRKPPEGFVSWGEPTFERLVAAEPEQLDVVLLGQPLDAAQRHRPARRPVRRDAPPARGQPRAARAPAAAHPHGDRDLPRAARRWRRGAAGPSRSRTAGRCGSPSTCSRTSRSTSRCRRSRSPSLELLDRDSPTYALDVLSVLEATLEDPRQVVQAQRKKARGEAVAAMKAEGIEYDERMELLEDVTYPQPLRELLEHAYETYRRGHPWVADHELKPKSVARDMYERAMTFTEYVGFYQLARSEGLVLRYLADAYKALRQTVPESARDRGAHRPDRVARRAGAPGGLQPARRVGAADQLDQVEQADVARHHVRDEKPPAVTSNARAFRVLVRNAMFRRVELAALRRYADLGELDADAGWDAAAWAEAHGRLLGRPRRADDRPGRPRAGPADGHRGAGSLGGAAGLRRPGRRPRLGHLGRRSTWPRRTRPARRSSSSPPSTGPTDPADAPSLGDTSRCRDRDPSPEHDGSAKVGA